jgi:RNA polymerase-binding transcription factor DksA
MRKIPHSVKDGPKKAARRAKKPPAKGKPRRSAARARPFDEEQREKLDFLKSHLVRRNEKVDRDLTRSNGTEEVDAEEQALARENDEVLEALSHEGRDQLELVEAALARIDAGTYGKCDGCADPIGRARLVARPYATMCVRCAAEQGG